MTTLKIPTARVFQPLLQPMRYKGAYGGRGSGKSHFFAEMLIERAVLEPGRPKPPDTPKHLLHAGLRAVCIREVQKTLQESSKRTIEDKIIAHNVGHLFDVQREQIITPGDPPGVIIFTGMKDHSAESIKSLERHLIAWIDEGQTISERSLSLLRPTLREDDSEIWISWNPTHKRDAVNAFLLENPPHNSIVVKANWRDNPFWSKTLETERLLFLEKDPELYEHVFEGAFATAFKGAYFTQLLTKAKLEGRITRLAMDPLITLRAFVDIGGAGAEADAFCIWIVQWVGQEIRVLNFYEAVGQPLAEHVAWMRKKGYENALVYLPHDGINKSSITGKTYATHMEEAGLRVEPPTRNQGLGAASMRIEAVRRLGPQLWFNQETTEDGRTALGFYHEKFDSERKMGQGPSHDWSSHAADAFGLMAICYEPPRKALKHMDVFPRGAGAWMGG